VVAGGRLGGVEQATAEPGGLQGRPDRQHAEIGQAVTLIGDLDAAHQIGVRQRQQQDAVRVGQDGGQFSRVGALAAQQVGLVGPAGLGRLAAIGAFNQPVQGRDIACRRGPEGDVRHRTPSSRTRWVMP